MMDMHSNIEHTDKKCLQIDLFHLKYVTLVGHIFFLYIASAKTFTVCSTPQFTVTYLLKHWYLSIYMFISNTIYTHVKNVLCDIAIWDQTWPATRVRPEKTRHVRLCRWWYHHWQKFKIEIGYVTKSVMWVGSQKIFLKSTPQDSNLFFLIIQFSSETKNIYTKMYFDNAAWLSLSRFL